MVDARVRATRLTTRGRGAHQRSAHREQVGLAHARRCHRVEHERGAVEALGVAQHTGVTRHDPLQLVADGDARCDVRRRRPRGHGVVRGRHASRPSRRARLARARSRRRRAPRTPGPRAASSTPAGWRRARRSTRPRRTPTARAGVRRAVEVGDHAAGQVVRGGRHRQPVARRDRGRPRGTRGQIVGKRSAKPSMRGGVEPEVVEAALDEPAADGPGHHVARREVGERVLVGHERAPVVVAQDRALAAQRLREQRARHRRVVQRGRVELHELEVGDRDAGPQRHRDAVAGARARGWW